MEKQKQIDIISSFVEDEMRKLVIDPFIEMTLKKTKKPKQRSRDIYDIAYKWQDSRILQPDVLALKVLGAYASNSDEPLNWLENDIHIFLMGYKVGLSNASKVRWDSIDKELNGGFQEGQYEERMHNLYNFMKSRMTKHQMKEFALCTKVRMADEFALTQRCVLQSGRSNRMVWNRKDPLCSKITTTNMDGHAIALKIWILRDIISLFSNT